MANLRILLKSNSCNTELSDQLDTACTDNSITLDTTVPEVMESYGAYIQKYGVRCVPCLIGVHDDGTKLTEATTVGEVATFEADFAAAIAAHEA